jgi:cytoskeleton protein RodZ
MTDDQQPPSEETRDTSELLGGERLARARREKQISVLEIAKELHLDEPKVRALERNEFDALGAAVFAKGYLRKYAQLVGADIDDILTDYYRMTRSSELPPVIIGRPKVRKELSPGPWIAAILVILVAAAAYWWFAVFQAAPANHERPTPEEAMPEEATPDSAATDEGTTTADTVALSEPRPQHSEPESPAEEAPPPVAGQTASESDGEARLSLRFSGDCWTEISDASGRRLFFGMGTAGRSVDLAGEPPFAVLFGNASNVQLQVDGTDFAIPAGAITNRTAKLTIAAP